MASSGPYPAGGREQLVDSFRNYLSRERGLAPGTVDNYTHAANLFVGQLADPLDDALRGLSAGQILEIIGVLVRPRGPSVRSMAVGLRALLRFLFVTDQVPRSLVEAVPNEPRWRLASLPARLDGSAVTALLQTCDRDTERGRRDYAILLLLARLGLRAAEVTGLVLEDIDWRGGGSSGRVPADAAGGALVPGGVLDHSRAAACDVQTRACRPSSARLRVGRTRSGWAASATARAGR